MSIAAVHVADRQRLRERLHAGTLETKLAVSGFVAIAIHVLDDNFFQPQPGTSPLDHLVSGLVPVAILSVAAAPYPRLRPGLRGTTLLVIGLLGVVIGSTEPVYYARNHGGLTGDDYTGLVAAAGGLFLVALGVVVLWNSRRRNDRLIRRYSRRLLLGIGTAVILYFVIFPFSLSYAFTHAARVETERGDLGGQFETVAFDASDGLRLKGWFVHSRNGAAVIVFPGKKGTQKHARMLVRHGYGVLVFDRRGEGESEGDPNALGWTFDRDLKGALRFLRGTPSVDPSRIGGLGLSVGGEAMLQTAAETKDLKAVVSDGAGARSVREDTVRVRAGKAPEIWFSAVMTAGTALFANQLPPPNLENLAARISPTPVFFIYASNGAGGEENNPNYYAAVRGPKQIWMINTSHTHGLTDRPRSTSGASCGSSTAHSCVKPMAKSVAQVGNPIVDR
jgi:hypothetical protein